MTSPNPKQKQGLLLTIPAMFGRIHHRGQNRIFKHIQTNKSNEKMRIRLLRILLAAIYRAIILNYEDNNPAVIGWEPASQRLFFIADRKPPGL